jgi:hypothetical protein
MVGDPVKGPLLVCSVASMESYSVCCRAHKAATRTRERKMRYYNSRKREKKAQNFHIMPVNTLRK